MLKIETKKIETIRINEKLAEYLMETPKGESYANWILDKIERLNAHEQNPVCWIVSISNISPNRMSVGDENGKNPIFDEIIEIMDEIPKSNLSHEEKTNGWLGQTNDYSEYAHGGFASVESARTYIKKYMGGRLIPEELLESYKENKEIYTTAKFDYDKYYFATDYFEDDEPNVEGLSDNEIENLAEKLKTEANNEGYCIVDDVEKYLKELGNST